MTHPRSDVLAASALRQPKLSSASRERLIRRTRKVLLGIALAGSIGGIALLTIGRPATSGLGSNAQVNPAPVKPVSTDIEAYQPGALAGWAPVEAWRAAEAGAPTALRTKLPYYADENGAGFGYVGDGMGFPGNGFADRVEERPTPARALVGRSTILPDPALVEPLPDLPYYEDELGHGDGYLGDGLGYAPPEDRERDEKP